MHSGRLLQNSLAGRKRDKVAHCFKEETFKGERGREREREIIKGIFTSLHAMQYVSKKLPSNIVSLLSSQLTLNMQTRTQIRVMALEEIPTTNLTSHKQSFNIGRHILGKYISEKLLATSNTPGSLLVYT